MILRARYVVPVESSVIEDGAVVIENGLIKCACRWSDVDASSHQDLGDVVVLPGLVNAHTHLELSHLAGRVDPAIGFARWIEELGRILRAMREQPDPVPDAVRAGIRQSLASGVTTVGDIARHPMLTRSIQRAAALRVVSFGEVIAVGAWRHLVDARLAEARDTTHQTDVLKIGITPHSPYSVEPDAFRACVQVAADQNLPLCVHAAESLEEEEFTRYQRGALRDLIGRLGLWDGNIPCLGLSPIPFLAHVGALGRDVLLAHVNYVTDEDLAALASSTAHVAYCPRTHSAFGHPPHPFQAMLKLGMNVCLATDSLASNPSLSVLDEARFLHARYEALPSELLMEMITVRGARALGLDRQVGSLARGKSADLTAVPLAAHGPRDPMENVLRSTNEPVMTMIRGQVVSSPTPSSPW